MDTETGTSSPQANSTPEEQAQQEQQVHAPHGLLKQFALRGKPEVNQRTHMLAEEQQHKQAAKAKEDIEAWAAEQHEKDGMFLQQQRQHAKQKRARELTTDEVEWETAMYVGLNESHVVEEEAQMLPKGIDLDRYVKVRNHVLSRWRADVTRYLHPHEAGQSILNKYQPLVQLAWTFLNTHGYINWGVAPGVLQEPAASTSSAGRSKPCVIVVGAGLAGAAAARQLVKAGCQVVVLEGRNRPGGRVWSMLLESQDGQHRCMADMGGAIVTGIHGNPLAVLATQLGLAMHHIREECPMYLAEGGEAPKDLDEEVHMQHNNLLDAAHEFREVLPPEVADACSVGTAVRMLWDQMPRQPGYEALHERLMHWHFSNVEFANAAQMHTLSLRGWDQDDPHEMLGPHILLPGCNGQLVEALLQDVPTCYNAVATKITYDSAGVSVTTAEDTTFTGDAVLVTVPLGVLKRGCIQFDPPLPHHKQDAINRLGFGVLNKVVLLFPYAFWDSKLDLLAHVAEQPEDTGQFFLLYAYGPHLAGQGAVLAALVSGAAAQNLETMDVNEARDRVMRVLRSMHEPQGITIPEPLQVACTRWASDPMSYGSYSSVAVGATGEDYDTMAEEVAGRVFFAGEATISKWPATMHGAFLSGIREAAKIQLNFSTSTKKRKKRAAAAATATATSESPLASDIELSEESDSVSDSEDDEEYYAGKKRGQRGMEGGRVTRSRAGHGGRGHKRHRAAMPPAAALQSAQELALVGHALRQVFQQVAPDVEFGCCRVLLGPPSSAWANKALMQIEHKGIRSGPKKSLALYMVLTREQLCVVRNAPWGDEGRIAALAGQLGLQLVGRAPQQQRDVVELLQELTRYHKLPHLLHASIQQQEAGPAPEQNQDSSMPQGTMASRPQPAQATDLKASPFTAPGASAHLDSSRRHAVGKQAPLSRTHSSVSDPVGLKQNHSSLSAQASDKVVPVSNRPNRGLSGQGSHRDSDTAVLRSRLSQQLPGSTSSQPEVGNAAAARSGSSQFPGSTSSQLDAGNAAVQGSRRASEALGAAGALPLGRHKRGNEGVGTAALTRPGRQRSDDKGATQAGAATGTTIAPGAAAPARGTLSLGTPAGVGAAAAPVSTSASQPGTAASAARPVLPASLSPKKASAVAAVAASLWRVVRPGSAARAGGTAEQGSGPDGGKGPVSGNGGQARMGGIVIPGIGPVRGASGSSLATRSSAGVSGGSGGGGGGEGGGG